MFKAFSKPMLGYFRFPQLPGGDQDRAGILDMDEGGNVRVKVIFPSEILPPSIGGLWGYRNMPGVICGRLENDKYVTLLDGDAISRSESRSPSRANATIAYKFPTAIVGKTPLEKEKGLRHVETLISGLNDWVDRSLLVKKVDVCGDSLQRYGAWFTPPKDLPLWAFGDMGKLGISHRLNFLETRIKSSLDEISMRAGNTCVYSADSAMPPQQLLFPLRAMLYFIGLGLGKATHYTSIHAWPYNMKKGNAFEVYDRRLFSPIPRRDFDIPLFPMALVMKKMPSILEQWVNLYRRTTREMDLFFCGSGDATLPESVERFLAISTSVENLSSTIFGSQYKLRPSCEKLIDNFCSMTGIKLPVSHQNIAKMIADIRNDAAHRGMFEGWYNFDINCASNFMAMLIMYGLISKIGVDKNECREYTKSQAFNITMKEFASIYALRKKK